MGAKKIVVPEGMLRAATAAWGSSENRTGSFTDGEVARINVEAALEWLSEDTSWIPDSETFVRKFYPDASKSLQDSCVHACNTWVRRMFLAPAEPKRFVECDACRSKSGSPTLCRGCLHNREVIEAYERSC